MHAATEVQSNITTLEDFLKWSTELFTQHELFFGHGTDNPWDEAVMLALYVLQLPAENDAKLLKQVLTPEQKSQLFNLAKRRAEEKIPVPYLTGEAWFAGAKYFVNEHVLIPRSPIAETIAQHFQPWLGDIQPQSILDMCTGSGCLAIYCAEQFPEAKVDAVDISKPALDVARQNIKLHHCSDRVQAIESDLFAALTGKRYDIIISNPPYVGAEEMAELPAEYLHEPKLALASGENGLDLTLKILQQAANYLTNDGLLIVEVGNSWHLLAEQYPQVPFTWLEFSYGGEGVFLLTAQQLQAFKS